MPAVIFLLIVGCDAGLITIPNADDADASITLSDEELQKLSMQLFTDKVQPVVATLKCPTCHTQAVGQTPFFADSSADLAFPAIEAKVNLTDIENSSILAKIKGPPPHNCSVAGCETDVQSLLEGLKAWQEGLVSAGITGEQYNLETTRLFPDADNRVSYTIGKLIDEQYDDQFRLEIAMKKLGSGNSYQLDDLMVIINGERGVFVKGIKILVNGSGSGKTAQSQPFKDIACAVRFTQSLNESVTTIVLDEAKDKLSFAFGEIRLATDDDLDCYSDRAMQRKFDSEIKPILEENCGECHDPSKANPQQPNASNFLNFNEAKKKKLMISVYLKKKKDNHPGNDNIDDLNKDEHNKIESWLQRLIDK